MEITLNVNESEGNRDFLDFAARLTLTPDPNLDLLTKDVGNRFEAIIDKVHPDQQNPDSPENVVDELYEFFQDHGYKVSKKVCLNILRYHNMHKFRKHGPQGGVPNY